MILDAPPEVVARVKPEIAVLVGPQRRELSLRGLQAHGRRFLLSLEGIDSRESAERLRGQTVYADEENLTPLGHGEYYQRDLLGLQVRGEDGRRIGILEQILRTGANDVWLVRLDDGRELLLPSISSVVLEIDPAGGAVTVQIPDGLEPTSA
jgi:16S rRNA processing protein RimM